MKQAPSPPIGEQSAATSAGRNATLSLPEDHQNGRSEVEVAEGKAAEAAFQQLRPFLRPEKAQDAKLVLQRTVSKYHRGPIPSAEELEHLERVLPGAAARCFDMAEREQMHRHASEMSIINKEFGLRTRGQWLAIVGLVLLLTVVGFLAYLGDTVSAAALGGGTIVAVVAIFVTGRFYDAKVLGDEPEPQQEKARQPSRSERRNREFGRD